MNDLSTPMTYSKTDSVEFLNRERLSTFIINISKQHGLKATSDCVESIENAYKQRMGNICIGKLRIEDPPRRKHMVFLGGAVLADIMKDNESFWITKESYEEEGVACLGKNAINKKI